MLPLLDTHQHLVYPDQVGYAWTDGIPVLANQSFEVEEYARLTADKGIGGTIFMETGVDDADYQLETRFIAKLGTIRVHLNLSLNMICQTFRITLFMAI